MAKKSKKKKDKKNKAKKANKSAAAGGALLGGLAGGVAGKVVTKLLADAVGDYLFKGKGKDGHGGHHHHDAKPREDVAAQLLGALADGGCKSVPDLLASTGAGLSEMLHALQTMRDFRLINFAGEPGEETVEATRSGVHTATVLRQAGIKEQATRLLAE